MSFRARKWIVVECWWWFEKWLIDDFHLSRWTIVVLPASLHCYQSVTFIGQNALTHTGKINGNHNRISFAYLRLIRPLATLMGVWPFLSILASNHFIIGHTFSARLGVIYNNNNIVVVHTTHCGSRTSCTMCIFVSLIFEEMPLGNGTAYYRTLTHVSQSS